ncbi:chromobox protein homolog 3 [Drosophila ananassae]|uniref:chromobox protein homolog 3 n=1 Tax=Drosophila ananassae TaxID=7217 RepID=UPI000177B9C4|nr:chromobox protein homolog 3 [Drosophila ananassae]
MPDNKDIKENEKIKKKQKKDKNERNDKIEKNDKEILDLTEELIYDDAEEFVVSRVCDRRINLQGQLEYRVHWEHCPDSDDTWEKASNLNCEALINSFERQRCLKIGQELNGHYKNKAKRLKIDPHLVTDNPFNFDFEAQRIIRGFNINGEISLLIKFKDMDEPQIVPAEIAYAEIPQMVLRFYEKHVDFKKAKRRES